MADRPAGPVEVRPNILRGQSVPNTFRSGVGDEAGPIQSLNRGGGTMAAANRGPGSLVPIRAIMVLVVVLIFVGLYLLTGSP